jgi:hypothetical protein
MSPRIALAVSTLALGTALTAIPAHAQNSGQANSCVHFGLACSNTPYPTSEQSQYNGGQRSPRTGSAENTEHAQARAAALGRTGPNYAFGEPNRQGRYYNYYAAGPSFASGQMDQDAIAACQARFRSYDPATGTYLGFDGARHPCP